MRLSHAAEQCIKSDKPAVLITTISRAIINKTAIMMIVASKVIKTSITTINIMTREVPKADMAKTAMGTFQLECPVDIH